jgi:hypothetical protein
MLVQLSDLHLREDCREPAERLAHAVRRVASLQPRPDGRLVSHV